MNFSEKIKSLREDKELTQNDMAQLIPMNQSNFSKIERGLQEPSLFQLKRIVEILNIDIYDLLEINSPLSNIDKDEKFAKEIKNLYKKYYK